MEPFEREGNMRLRKLFGEFIAEVSRDKKELSRWAYLLLTGCFENQFRDHFAWFLQMHTAKLKWVGRDSHVKDARFLKGIGKGDIVHFHAEKPEVIIELKAAYDFNVPRGHLDEILMFRRASKYSLSKDLSRWKKLGIKLFGILLVAHITPDSKLPVICEYVKRKSGCLRNKMEVKKIIQKKLRLHGWRSLRAFDVDLSAQMKRIVPGYSTPCSLSGYLLSKY